MSASGGRSAGVAWLPLAAIVAVAAVVLVAVGSGGGDEALDPGSHGRLGTSALVALAGDLGTEVTVTDRVPTAAEEPAAGDVVLVLDDVMDPAAVDDLDAWVEAGGTLVVTDPASSFTPEVSGEVEGPGGLARAVPPSAPGCTVDPLRGLDVTGVAPRHGGVLYAAPPWADTCLTVQGLAPGVEGSGSYVVATPRGRGTVVAVGGSGMFVNAALAEGENAPVAIALVAPRAGSRLTVLEPGPLAGGATSPDETLGELIPDNVWRLLIQLGLALGVYVAWRARRLGRPVVEPRPVTVAASELVAATGSLLDRAGARQHAADVIRRDLHRRLAAHLGVPPATPPAALAAVAAERTGADPDRVLAVLDGRPVADDAGLVALAHATDLVREEVLDHV